MGDPKVQRSDSGFFTRLGRAIDAFGQEDPKTKKVADKKSVDAAQPLPKKYRSTPRRMDRSVVSAPGASDPAAYTIKQNESYVAKALKLADDMRALAAKESAWYNRTTPKDVDKVTNKYSPLIMATRDSHQKRQLAELMLKELYDTPTADNLFWEVGFKPVPIDIRDLKDLERRPTLELMAIMEESDRMKTVEPYQCTSQNVQTRCWNGSMTTITERSCTIGGVHKTQITDSCPPEPNHGERGAKWWKE